jgi:hypothetical protein
MDPLRIPVRGAVGLAGLFLVLGLGAGASLAARHRSAPASPSVRTPPRMAQIPNPRPASENSEPPTAAGLFKIDLLPLSGELPLAERLTRLRTILRAQEAATRRGSDLSGIHSHLAQGWPELHEAVLKDLDGFFAFVRAPENEDVCEGLLSSLAFAPGLSGPGGWRFRPFPAGVVKGIRDMIVSGTVRQMLVTSKIALAMTDRAPGKCDSLLEPCLALLSHDNPHLQSVGLAMLQARKPEQLEQSLPLIDKLWKKSEDEDVRLPCLSSLAAARSPAANQVFFEKVSEVFLDPASKPSFSFFYNALNEVRGKLLAGDAIDAERYGDLLGEAVRRTVDPPAFRSIVNTALDLPLAKATVVLEQAVASAPDEDSGAEVRKVLQQIHAGEVRAERLRLAIRAGGPLF